MNEISEFFNGLGVERDDDIDNWFDNIIFICSNEFHWTQEEFFNTDIPYLLRLLIIRNKVLKKQEEDMRRSQKRR